MFGMLKNLLQRDRCGTEGKLVVPEKGSGSAAAHWGPYPDIPSVFDANRDVPA
jgi:hypothetical protein